MRLSRDNRYRRFPLLRPASMRMLAQRRSDDAVRSKFSRAFGTSRCDRTVLLLGRGSLAPLDRDSLDNQ